MSLLKKIGAAILKGAMYAAGIVPAIQGQIQPAMPQSEDMFNYINGIIQTIEAIGQAAQTPGPDKLKMAIPLVSAALLKYTNDLHHEVKDEALFQKACDEYTQASVDLQNSLKG